MAPTLLLCAAVPRRDLGLPGLPGVHWGALLFTVAIGGAALLVVRPLLSMPLAAVPEATGADDGAEPTLDVPTPVAQSLHSRWYTQTIAPVLEVGETGFITIQFQNVGQADWVRGTASEIRLGEVGARPLPTEMKVDWPLPNRPAVQEEPVVHVNQTATFAFKVRGTSAGVYRLMVRPVVDGVAWLEDEGVFVDIHVR